MKITLKIPGMSCQGCVANVSRILEGIDGVRSSQVSLESHEAWVDFDQDQVSPEAITEALTSEGYPPEQ